MNIAQKITPDIVEANLNIPPHTEFRNHILTVTVASDDGRPLLYRRAYDRLGATLRAAAEDDQTRVVVLRGLSGCFCLGGDLQEFLDATKHAALIEAVTGMFRTLATFPKPILACVDGDAVGVGCSILFHCDMVIAAEKSTFRVPFVDLGLVPDAATSILAPERLGYAAAFRFFCLGDTLTATEAKDLGLVAEIAPGDAGSGRMRGRASSPRSRSRPCALRASCCAATDAISSAASTRRSSCSRRRCRTIPRCAGWPVSHVAPRNILQR